MAIVLDGTAGITTPDLTDTSLTSGRVVYAGASGNLTGSANLTFDGTKLSSLVGAFGTGAAFGTESLQVAKTNGTGVVGSAYQFAINSKTANNRAEMIMTDGSTANAFISYSPNATASNDKLTINLQGSDVVTVVGNGNVGIGTSSPSFKLDVLGSSTSGSGIVNTLRLQHTGVTGNDGPKILFTVGASTDGAGIGAGAQALNSADLRFYAGGNTERARIDTSGNLMVGTTSAGTSRFHVYEDGGANGQVIRVTNATGNTGVAFVSFRWTSSGTEVGYISTNGTTTTYATSSDYRLKNTIAPMTGALAKVALLKPVTYKWNADNSNGEGFIAHELQAVVPECVTGAKDAVDADGTPVHQGIDTTFLVATLTAAIQEQQALITTLTERITALEGA